MVEGCALAAMWRPEINRKLGIRRDLCDPVICVNDNSPNGIFKTGILVLKFYNIRKLTESNNFKKKFGNR